MADDAKRLKAGWKVRLRALPPGFLDGLPPDDQKAILAVVGKPILLTQFEEDGRAELAFRDSEGDLHTIYIDPKYLE
jgi:hypothetical protein